MKVILLKDVPKVGRRLDVKTVSDGYAANFLFPKKLAEPATEARIKEIAGMHARSVAERKVEENLLLQNLVSLEGKTVVIEARANEKGHLFKGVRTDDIAKALAVQAHSQLLPEHILLDAPVKEVGVHTLEVEVYGKRATFTLEVQAA